LLRIKFISEKHGTGNEKPGREWGRKPCSGKGNRQHSRHLVQQKDVVGWEIDGCKIKGGGVALEILLRQIGPREKMTAISIEKFSF